MLANGLQQSNSLPAPIEDPMESSISSIELRLWPDLSFGVFYYWVEATLHHPYFHPKSPVHSPWIFCPHRPPSNLINTSTPSLDYESKPISIVITPPPPLKTCRSPWHWPPPLALSNTTNADPDSHVPGRAKLNVKCMVGLCRLHCAEGESGRWAASLLLSADRVWQHDGRRQEKRSLALIQSWKRAFFSPLSFPTNQLCLPSFSLHHTTTRLLLTLQRNRP